MHMLQMEAIYLFPIITHFFKLYLIRIIKLHFNNYKQISNLIPFTFRKSTSRKIHRNMQGHFRIRRRQSKSARASHGRKPREFKGSLRMQSSPARSSGGTFTEAGVRGTANRGRMGWMCCRLGVSGQPGQIRSGDKRKILRKGGPVWGEQFVHIDLLYVSKQGRLHLQR